MKKLLFGFGVFFLISCSAQETIGTMNSKEKELLKEFQSIPNSATLQMTKESEPGKKLLICLTFVNKEGLTPLKDQKVLLYQTSNDGNYNSEVTNDERTARIRAQGFTDEEGRLFVKTILPGSYATSGDNRHIHTQVFGAKPEAYDIHFKQHTGARMKRFIEQRDQFFLADLKYTTDKQLVCFVTMKVKNPK
ncbi:MAG: hypothetical protein JXR05_03835 [Flavobacteriaceae bacterium]